MAVVAVTYPWSEQFSGELAPGAPFLWEWKPPSQQCLPEHWRDVPRGIHDVPEGWAKEWSKSTWVLADLSLRIWIYFKNCLFGWSCSSMVDPWPSVHQAPTLIPRNTKNCLFIVLDLSIRFLVWHGKIQFSRTYKAFGVNEPLVLRNRCPKDNNIFFFALLLVIVSSKPSPLCIVRKMDQYINNGNQTDLGKWSKGCKPRGSLGGGEINPYMTRFLTVRS